VCHELGSLHCDTRGSEPDIRYVGGRHSIAELTRLTQIHASIVLSVPVHGMEELVKAIGGCHGSDTGPDKPEQLGVELCRPGWRSLSAASDDEDQPAVGKKASARKQRSLQKQARRGRTSVTEQQAHSHDIDADATTTTTTTTTTTKEPPAVASGCVAHMVCSIQSRSEIDGHQVMVCRITEAFVRESYWDGRNFVARGSAPPYLAFLGSQVFAYTCGAPVMMSSTDREPIDHDTAHQQ